MLLSKDILARTLWFLDYDGSLCPHQEVWEIRSYDPAEIWESVNALASVARGVLWNTGRRPVSLEGVHPRFLEYSGYFVQSSVRWDAPTRAARTLSPRLDPAVGAVYEEALRGERRLRLEIKETGLRVASVGSGPSLVKSFLARHQSLCPAGWSWRHGHRGSEMLPNGFDKGFAVIDEMKRWPEDTIPVAVGDDVFDRPAFEECLKRGGYVVAVGEGCGWVTELAHHPKQVIFCETPADVSRLWLRK